MKKKLFIFVLCVFLQGCVTSSTTLKLNPQILTGQKEVSLGGLKTVVSEKKVRVAVSPLKDTYSNEECPTFVVSVYTTGEPFDFSPKDIQVLVDGIPDKILTYDELVSNIKEQKRALIRKARMEKELKNQNAADNQTQARAVREMTAKIDAVEKYTDESLRYLNSHNLGEIKVAPNKQYSGNITIGKISDPSKAKEIKVIVTAAGEKHEFLINLAMI